MCLYFSFSFLIDNMRSMLVIFGGYGFLSCDLWYCYFASFDFFYFACMLSIMACGCGYNENFGGCIDFYGTLHL